MSSEQDTNNTIDGGSSPDTTPEETFVDVELSNGEAATAGTNTRLAIGPAV